MAHIKQLLVRDDLINDIKHADLLVKASLKWNLAGKVNGLPIFSNTYLDMVIGLAFLRIFLAWEQFLEESFILYLLGKSSPTRFKPFCYVKPSNREHAINFTRGGNKYADWTSVTTVVEKANLFFRDGAPYNNALRPKSNLFDEMKILRNAIAHNSDESNTKFMSLVRRRLGHYPPRLTPGGFLSIIIAGSVPQSSYLQFYISELEKSALLIIP